MERKSGEKSMVVMVISSIEQYVEERVQSNRAVCRHLTTACIM
jgi:hypothetical protein